MTRESTEEPTQSAKAPVSPRTISVAVRPSVAEPVEQIFIAEGQALPDRDTAVRAEISGQISEVLVEMGDDLEDLVNAKEGYALAEGDRKKRLRSLRSEQSHKEQRVRAMRLKLNSLATTRGEHQVCIWMTASVAPLLGLLCC